MTTRSETLSGICTVSTTDSEINLAKIIGVGLATKLKNSNALSATPTPSEKTGAQTVEDFGNILNAAGGIMSCVRKNSDDQPIVTYNIINQTDYTVTFYYAGSEQFQNAYVIEHFESIASQGSAVLKFEINHAYSLSDNPFSLNVIIADSTNDTAYVLRMRLGGNADGDFGLNSINIIAPDGKKLSSDFDLTPFGAEGGAALTGAWIAGVNNFPSFCVSSFTQRDSLSDFSITLSTRDH